MTNSDNTGFCVPYTVRLTPGKGQGVFADAPIPKGTMLWRHVHGQYAVYDEPSFKELLARLPRSEVVYELEHIYGVTEFPGYVIRIFDDGVLINHSRHPTAAINNPAGDQVLPYNALPRDRRVVAKALLSDRFALIATRDLVPGDELTMDYTIDMEDPPYYVALCEQYGLSWSWL